MRPRPAAWHVSPTALAISAAAHGALAAAAIAMAGLFEPATPHAVVPVELVFEPAGGESEAAQVESAKIGTASAPATDAAPPAAVAEPRQAAAATSEDRVADEPPAQLQESSQALPAAQSSPPELPRPEPVAVAPAAPKASPQSKPRPARERGKPISAPRRVQAVDTSARDSAPVPLTAALTSSGDSDATGSEQAIDAAKEGPPGGRSDPLALRAGNAAPAYPDLARRRGWEGRVLLRVVVDVTGAPSEIAVGRSSGYRLLDESALAAVQRWRFEPARLAGIPVVATVDVPVVFRLTD